MKQFTIKWNTLHNIAFPVSSIEKIGLSVSIDQDSIFEQLVTISMPEHSSDEFTPELIFRLGTLVGQLNALERI